VSSKNNFPPPRNETKISTFIRRFHPRTKKNNNKVDAAGVVARDQAIFHGTKKVALLSYKALLANTHILFQLNVGIFKLSFSLSFTKREKICKKNTHPFFSFYFPRKTSKIQ